MAGVWSLLLDLWEPEVDLASIWSSSPTSWFSVSLPARLFVAWPVLRGETCDFFVFLPLILDCSLMVLRRARSSRHSWPVEVSHAQPPKLANTQDAHGCIFLKPSFAPLVATLASCLNTSESRSHPTVSSSPGSICREARKQK